MVALASAACFVKPNDYDGDKRADVVYVVASGPAAGAWMQYGNPTPLWAGMHTGVAVGGDYDNDGRWEPAELQGRDWFSSKLASPIHYDPPGLPTATPDWPTGSSPLPAILPVPADYDGNGRTDPAYYAVADGTWWIEGRAGSVPFGVPPTADGHLDWDVPVPADYDGDLKADIAVFSPHDHEFRILESKSGTVRVVHISATLGTVPVPADYDGDGKADPAVTDAAGTTWWLDPSATQPTFTFSVPLPSSSYPVVADYDGDDTADPAMHDWENSVVRAELAGVDTVVARISPDDAGRPGALPALPYALAANLVRLQQYAGCLAGTWQPFPASPPLPNWEICPPA